eukprot:gnl/MRDRNA2_/MRDRNA2_62176_c1_seq1.p1 gnl/MRDRNA2_/MRDRNA2_62176_c1~~gnl/MRDRNA2_/MRDRNA2_62176_c1_seq1.p1  ORF type:complete len:173 (+),score=21.23 gnl/MRDRNA2_/MRDRNA2_62176_c1_seq1:48-521(+)
MSRSSYGNVWHQAAYRPVTNNCVTSEALPKNVPPEGCGFSGIPDDFPAERRKWYTEELMGHRSGRGLEFGIDRLDVFKTPAFPECVKVPSMRSRRSRSSSTIERPRTCDDSVPRQENSRMFMMHGRYPSRPEAKEYAGLACFDMRRWQLTNTSSQFL